MIVTTNENGTIVFEKVFSPIKFITPSNETLILMMRDSGFEIFYENEFYELKEGKIITNKSLN